MKIVAWVAEKDAPIAVPIFCRNAPSIPWHSTLLLPRSNRASFRCFLCRSWFMLVWWAKNNCRAFIPSSKLVHWYDAATSAKLKEKKFRSGEIGIDSSRQIRPSESLSPCSSQFVPFYGVNRLAMTKLRDLANRISAHFVSVCASACVVDSIPRQ